MIWICEFITLCNILLHGELHPMGVGIMQLNNSWFDFNSGSALIGCIYDQMGSGHVCSIFLLYIVYLGLGYLKCGLCLFNDKILFRGEMAAISSRPSNHEEQA